MSLLRTAARRLGFGKYRYWKGTDLEGNQFFERPHPEFPDEWRKNKRYIEYAKVKPLSDYNYETIPVQWSAWLRRTRREPPTLEELEVDLRRQLRLRDNVARLEAAYADERLRLAQHREDARRIGAPSSVDTPEDTEATGRDTAPIAGGMVDGLPLEDAGVDAAAGRRAPRVARKLDGIQHGAASVSVGAAGSEGLPRRNGATAAPRGSGAPHVSRDLRNNSDRVEPSQGQTRVGADEMLSPEELARRRRDEEHAAALKRRAEFARQNPAPLKGNPGDSHQPQGWSPTAPARRR